MYCREVQKILAATYATNQSEKRISFPDYKADCAKVTKYCRCNSVLLTRRHSVQRDSYVTCRPVLYVNTCEGVQGIKTTFTKSKEQINPASRYYNSVNIKNEIPCLC
jgi:quinolinate synthase